MEAMASVTVETATVLLVGMETNVNSSVTSAHGKASGDVHLQMAKSAATEARACVGSVSVMMWTPLETGGTFMETPVSVTRETALPPTTDTQTTSAQVTDSVTVADVTAERVGQGGSVSTRSRVHCLWRAA